MEPYFGSGAVFFNKAPAKHEVINDLSGDVVNLFRVIREDGERLAALIEMTPFARDEFEYSFIPCDEPIERARRFLVRCGQGGPAASYRHTGWRNNPTSIEMFKQRALQWIDTPFDIRSAITRLRVAEIENRNAVELVKDVCRSHVLIYADPPYINAARTGGRMYQHEMTDADHTALLDALDAHPGPVVLSGYHCALYDDRLRHWHTREKQVQAEKGNTRTEVLWLNQVCIDRLGFGPLFAA